MPPKTSALQQSIVIQSKFADHNQKNDKINQWSEYPETNDQDCWDEKPVGGGGAAPNPNPNPYHDGQQLATTAVGKKRQQTDKIATAKATGMNTSGQSNSNAAEESMSIAPPKIGLSEFELMIEKAM